MSVTVLYCTYPTDKVIEIVLNSDNLVEDIIKTFDIGYNLTEAVEDDDKYEFMKNTLHTMIPTFHTKERIDIWGLYYIVSEIEKHLGVKYWAPFTSKQLGIFDRGTTKNSDELVVFQSIAQYFYESIDFPITIQGVVVEDSCEDKHKIVRISDIRQKEIDNTIYEIVESNFGSVDKTWIDLEKMINLFDIAKSREEDVIYEIG